MTTEECYATGGPVDPKKLPVIGDNAYVIPTAFAQKWAREILDRLNANVLDKANEDVIE